MNETTIKFIIWTCGLIVGLIIGLFTFSYAEVNMMEGYDLYNCIYNNADANGFTQNPYLVQKVQDECICFREHNYTNLMEANC